MIQIVAEMISATTASSSCSCLPLTPRPSTNASHKARLLRTENTHNGRCRCRLRFSRFRITAVSVSDPTTTNNLNVVQEYRTGFVDDDDDDGNSTSEFHSPRNDVVSYTAKIAGYARTERVAEALQVFVDMQEKFGIQPNRVSFITVLGFSDVDLGKQIHARVLKAGMLESSSQDSYYEYDYFHAGKDPDHIKVWNALLNMYVKASHFEDAHKIFDRMGRRPPGLSVVSWTTMISGLASCGRVQEAFDFLVKMLQQGIRPSVVTFIVVLTLFDVELGIQLHGLALKTVNLGNVKVGSALMDMYARYGELDSCFRVFQNMSGLNVVAWTTMISAHARHGSGKKAFHLLVQMLNQGIQPNHVAFSSLLPYLGLQHGIQIHACSLKSRFYGDITVQSALMSMYVKRGRPEEAAKIFEKMSARNLVTWTTMVMGFANSGETEKAFEMLVEMCEQGIQLNDIAFISVLRLFGLEQGRQLHASTVKAGLLKHTIVGNVVIGMYGRFGALDDAYKAFEKLPTRNVVSWTTMISAYALSGYTDQAFRFFVKMMEEGVRINEVTVVSVLSFLGLEECRQVHAHVLKNGFHYDKQVRQVLEDVYRKSEEAVDVQGDSGSQVSCNNATDLTS